MSLRSISAIGFAPSLGNTKSSTERLYSKAVLAFQWAGTNSVRKFTQRSEILSRTSAGRSYLTVPPTSGRLHHGRHYAILCAPPRCAALVETKQRAATHASRSASR